MKLGPSQGGLLLLSLSYSCVYGFLPSSAPWQCQSVAGGRQVRESSKQHATGLYSARSSSTALLAKPVVEERPKKAVDHVVIRDRVGHSISCTVDAFLNHDGRRYCLATPVDSVMLLMDSRGNLIDPAEEIVDKMYNQLDNYFTDRGFEILHTAGFLTVTGNPVWDADEDVDDEYDTDGEGDEDTFLRDDEEEPVIEEGSLRADPIADVEFEGGNYKIAQLMDKLPLSAVQDGDGSIWYLIDDTAVHSLLVEAVEEAR